MRKLVVALIALPVFAGAADFVITDYGARPDGSKCSAAFKAAFEAAIAECKYQAD
jgi:hypothetical protein